MFSEYDSITLIILSQKYLYQFGGLILIIIGTLSCTMSLIVFSRNILRKSACSSYLIALNISNIITMYLPFLILVLDAGYNIHPTLYSLIFCRFNLYVQFLFDILCPFYMILASIDRVLITSSNARTRQRSTHHFAYICIISGTLFWMLFQTHTLIFGSIIEYAPNYFLCYFQSGAYLVFIAYYAILIKTILVPLLLITCGLWSVKNIRSLRRIRVAPVLSMNRITTAADPHPLLRARDRQLVRMLLIDIIIYIIFNWAVSVFLMYQQATQYTIKSSVQNLIEVFIASVSTFSNHIPFCIECYTNLIVSKTFRNEVKKVLLCK
ncbi:unnamed protein product [Adineta steineri]|uniref:G-protein coupled receptors family 1 profile domain-containing protein n=1 Tax=Adineta steineri TaxID=433720 RepID=A0A819K577_9BILA|nr:unnamed protein product [Adineta steineri]CAF3943073.1 unnamed protein product [Adineta steineri]